MRHLPGATIYQAGTDGEAAFKLLFYRMPIASMLVEVSTSRVIEVNPAFEQLFGWQPENINRSAVF